MAAKNGMAKFPPQVGDCPDYWQKDASTGNCLNVQNLGINCPSPANFDTPDYLGPDGLKINVNLLKIALLNGMVFQIWDYVINIYVNILIKLFINGFY